MFHVTISVNQICNDVSIVGFNLEKRRHIISCNFMAIVVLFVLLSTVLAEDCVPFGVRTFFGRAYLEPSDPELLSLKFNTQSPCSSSFLKAKQGTFSTVFPCSSLEVSATNKTTFTTYVHSCSVTGMTFTEDIEYSVYGVDSWSQSYQYKNQAFLISMVDPNVDKPNKFLVFADWGPILSKNYTSLVASFNSLLENNRTEINGILLQGDIGYDLDTNQCKNYVNFINLISQVGVSWPVIISSGNHEYNTANNWKLYSQSFEIYGMKDKKVQVFKFKWLTFMGLDFYRQVYGLATSGETDAYVDLIRSEMEQAKGKPWSVAASHYPMFCSYSSKNCSTLNNTLQPFFDLMNDYRYDMYLGAHTHTYERQFPYFKGNVTPLEGPYHNIDSIVSVVEGVAGNDKDIVQETYQLKYFTAKATYNETGFGVLSVHNSTHLDYSHFSTKSGTHLGDSVLITKYSTGTADRGQLTESII